MSFGVSSPWMAGEMDKKLLCKVSVELKPDTMFGTYFEIGS